MAADDQAKRVNPRSPLQIDLSSILLLQPDLEPVRCLGVDVSKSGIGIVGFRDLPAGTSLVLALSQKQVELVVVWCKGDKVRSHVFHSGLKVKDASLDVEKELQAAGLLQRVEAWTFRTLKPRGGAGP